MVVTDEDNHMVSKRLALIFKYWMVKFLSDSVNVSKLYSPPSPLSPSSCPTHLASGVISTAAAVCRPLLPTLVLLRASAVSTLSRAFFSVPSASPSNRLPAEEGLRGRGATKGLTQHSTRAPYLESTPKSPLHTIYKSPSYRALPRAPYTPLYKSPLQSTIENSSTPAASHLLSFIIL